MEKLSGVNKMKIKTAKYQIVKNDSTAFTLIVNYTFSTLINDKTVDIGVFANGRYYGAITITESGGSAEYVYASTTTSSDNVYEQFREIALDIARLRQRKLAIYRFSDTQPYYNEIIDID